MILVVAVSGTLVVLVVFTLAGWSVKTQVRRHRRSNRLLAHRLERAPEDLCWRYCRDDAYQQALYIALRRRVDGDQRLLRDLGVQVERRFEVVQ